MPAEDRQQLSFPDVGEKSNDASQVRSRPVISNTNSLEDGEIREGRLSRIQPQPSSQQAKDQPQPCPSNRATAATPVCSGPTAEPAASPAPTIEPMTKEDLDRAKSLVLDLLGWGVTPEYLVECGLSPGAIYTIFTDLRLRLPSNLEIPSPSLTHHSAQ